MRLRTALARLLTYFAELCGTAREASRFRRRGYYRDLRALPPCPVDRHKSYANGKLESQSNTIWWA